MRAMAKKKAKKPSNVIAQNKRARFDYQLLETFEAGVALTVHGVQVAPIALKQPKGLSKHKMHKMPKKPVVGGDSASPRPPSKRQQKQARGGVAPSPQERRVRLPGEQAELLARRRPRRARGRRTLKAREFRKMKARRIRVLRARGRRAVRARSRAPPFRRTTTRRACNPFRRDRASDYS